ncbi:MAG TPA: hypothetical protein VFC39_21550 [Acidobacteriaceae bacterium]|nr:hypothetical protein [Acidobacteriaceae bacterium]
MTTQPQAKPPHAALFALTLCTLVIHGYHPLAEDGGLYAAGIQSALDPTLFPHDLAFATATRHYSLLTPIMAAMVRTLHIPLPWLLLITYLAGTWLFLYAAWSIAARCFQSEPARLSATALAATWYTLPIAGTSLLLMDPYVTARTLSTPLSLFALALALNFEWSTPRGIFPCIFALAAAAAFHPLMTAYAAALILTLVIAKLPCQPAQIIGFSSLTAAALILAGVLQLKAPPENVPTIAASFSRYYWFLSQWQWYELLGLAGPLIILALLLRFGRPNPTAAALIRAAIALGLIATLVSLLFAHESYSTHLVARLQPLRAFLLIYAVMTILLGGTLADISSRTRILAPLALTAMALLMFFVQRQTYPASQHLELPGRATANPWSQAFVWAGEHTPTDALFALDSNYITTAGEDGQTFRATARRSTLPDFSKDGGEAAVRPSLAEWYAGQAAQQNLSTLTDAQRRQRLQPLGVTWLILHATAPTPVACPYTNAVVKVCPLN